MRFLVSEKLGPHKFKTPEGYLICTDAILSRTGKQEYKRCELFGDACEDPDELVQVDRTNDEVFSDKAMASFENKAICVEHPDVDVNAENHNDLSVGFVRDIHKGEYEGEPVMMGTLVITDKAAIDAVESGEYEELSCGYDCDIDDDDNPQQRNIRGNHVALCKHGRAGIARIVDSVKDSYYQIDMSDRDGYTHSLVVKANSHEEAKTKASKFKPDWKYKAAYQVTERDIEWAKNRGLYVDSIKEEQPSIKALGKWEWDEVMQDWYDNGRHMYYNEVIRRSAGKDSVKDVNGLTKFKTALRNISKMYSSDPGIEYVTSTLKNLGYEVVIDSIDGWKENKNVPGEHIKQYRMNVMLEGREHHFLVQLYADMGEWKVKEINAYMLDSNNAKQEDSMKDEDFSKKTKQGFAVVEMYRDGGRLHVIFKRANDYGVALGYDTTDGQWAQGMYDYSTLNKAREALKETKPYAKRIQDSVDDDTWSNVEEENYEKANKPISAKDAAVCDADVIESSEHSKIGNYWYGYFFVKHSKYGDFYVSFRIKGNRNEVQLDGTGWEFIKSKGYTSEQKTWIAQHKSELERVRSRGTVADSKEQLFTIEYKQGDTMYIRKVRASSITDAISKVKDNGHKVVVFTNQVLNELGKNNSIGKYDKVVQAMRSLYSESLLPDDKLKELIRKKVPEYIKKYVKE